MKESVALFDTNVYRNIGSNKTIDETLREMEGIQKLESQKNIKACGLLVVGMELLGNLSDGPGSLPYNECLHGLIAMAHHCYENTRNDINVAAHSYPQLCQSFFKVIPDTYDLQSKNLGGTIADFKKDYPKALSYHHQNGNFQAIKSYIEKEEKAFSQRITDFIEMAKLEILNAKPNLKKGALRTELLHYIQNGPYNSILGRIIIQAIAFSLNIQLSEEEIISKANALSTELPLSTGFLKWISYKIVNNKIDMQSKHSKHERWNWQWDYEATFLISKHTLAGKEPVLVTEDEDIRQVLRDYGYSTRVFKLQEYLSFLRT